MDMGGDERAGGSRARRRRRGVGGHARVMHETRAVDGDVESTGRRLPWGALVPKSTGIRIRKSNGQTATPLPAVVLAGCWRLQSAVLRGLTFLSRTPRPPYPRASTELPGIAEGHETTELMSRKGPIGPGQCQPRAMRIRQVRFVRDLRHRRPHSRRPPYAGPLSTHMARVFLHATEADNAPISRLRPSDLPVGPAAEDGSWSLNFELCCVRKRTSRVSNVTHLPHHPTTPASFRATPAQTPRVAPLPKNSRRWAPLGAVERPGGG